MSEEANPVKVITTDTLSYFKDKMSVDFVTQDALNVKQTKRLLFKNVNVIRSSWKADSTYTSYGYVTSVKLTGVTANHFVEVVLSNDDAVSGQFGPVVDSYDGGVKIYAADIPLKQITIPTIIAWE